MSRATVKMLGILTLATYLSSCTGGPSPRPPAIRSPLFRMQTAAELVATIQKTSQGLHGCSIPLGPTPYGASGDLQCMLDGKFVRLSFTPHAAPTTVSKLWGRAVLFGTDWFVIASDLGQVRTIQRVIGGRLYLMPVLVAPRSVTLVGPRPRSCPIGCPVRFRVSVRNPMDRQAVISCHARGLSADGKVLFREPSIALEGLQRPTDAGAVTQLVGVAQTEHPGIVAKVIAWCTARPVIQPQ